MLVNRLRAEVCDYFRHADIALGHIPAHVGFPPNELIDRLAERGCQCLQVTLCYIELCILASPCPAIASAPITYSIADALWWAHYAERAVHLHTNQLWLPPAASEPLLLHRPMSIQLGMTILNYQ